MLRDDAAVAPRCALEEEYGAALVLDNARVTVNLVSTLDGIASFGLGRGDSRAVGGGVPADRLVMAMLRAVAGVIVVGAGTLRATPDHQWTPDALLPGRGDDLAALREVSGRPRPAPLLVVSATGRLPHDADAIARPGVPVTVLTARGAAGPADVVEDAEAALVDPAAVIAEARRIAGDGPILCEGGPLLFGSLLDAATPVDLFLTIAPQLAGSTDATPQRRHLVEGVALPPFSRAATLLSIRSAGDHLLLRYRADPA